MIEGCTKENHNSVLSYLHNLEFRNTVNEGEKYVPNPGHSIGIPTNLNIA